MGLRTRPRAGYAGAVSSSPPPALEGLELAVMEEIWRQAEATVGSVADAVNAVTGTRRAYTTYLTVMRRLDAKGVVVRERRAKTDHYRPVHPRDAYLEARTAADIEAIVSRFGDRALVQFARRIDDLDPQRRADLERLARGE